VITARFDNRADVEMQSEQKVNSEVLRHYVRTCASKLLCVRDRGIFGKRYDHKLVCARDGRRSRWESVARRRDQGARGKRRNRGAGTGLVGKLTKDHIFREFENIVHVVGLRLKNIRVWCWRT